MEQRLKLLRPTASDYEVIQRKRLRLNSLSQDILLYILLECDVVDLLQCEAVSAHIDKVQLLIQGSCIKRHARNFETLYGASSYG